MALVHLPIAAGAATARGSGAAKVEETVSIHTQRTLSATGDDAGVLPHDFPVSVPVTCHRSSYFSPYRVYARNDLASGKSFATNAGVTTFLFRASVAPQCPQPDAFCCTQMLDSILVKIGERWHGSLEAQRSNACMHATA
jgi:hypothetical protein